MSSTLLAIGTATTAFGQMAQGDAAEADAKFRAQQMRRKAIAEEASSQRDAIEERRKAMLLQSRATMLAAAGGTGVDIGAMDIISKIQREGEFNALTALFEGEERAATLRTGAEVSEFQGEREKKASRIKAISTIFSGAGKLTQRGAFG